MCTQLNWLNCTQVCIRFLNCTRVAHKKNVCIRCAFRFLSCKRVDHKKCLYSGVHSRPKLYMVCPQNMLVSGVHFAPWIVHVLSTTNVCTQVCIRCAELYMICPQVMLVSSVHFASCFVSIFLQQMFVSKGPTRYSRFSVAILAQDSSLVTKAHAQPRTAKMHLLWHLLGNFVGIVTRRS